MSGRSRFSVHGPAIIRRMVPHNGTDATIAVVMTTFNHEKYIAEAITSVLRQTLRDFELIIVNDGSTDGTDDVIRTFRDRRIRYIRQENQGESAALNNGIARTHARYIALMDGDDVCYPHRLERQLAFLTSQPRRAVTSWIDLIDDDSGPIHDQPELLALANAPPCRTRAGCLRRLWIQNYLWPSSAMLECRLIRQARGFCPTSAQLQDHFLWVELIKRAHIDTIPEPLIHYRLRSGALNMSRNPANAARTAFEMKQLYRGIFDRLPIALFREAFAQEIRNPHFSDGVGYAIEKALLYLTHPAVSVREIGVEKLFVLMQDRRVTEMLADVYGFSMSDFYRLENDPTYRALPWS